MGIEEVSDENYNCLLRGRAEFFYAYENNIISTEIEDFDAEVKIEEEDSIEINRIEIRERL